MTADNWHAALRLAASWPDATAEVRKAWEGCARPDFQRQLGRDPESLVAAGIKALRLRFGYTPTEFSDDTTHNMIEAPDC